MLPGFGAGPLLQNPNYAYRAAAGGLSEMASLEKSRN